MAPQMFDRVSSTIALSMVNRALSRIGAAQIILGRLDEHR